jgi:hypothetical protein
MHCDEPGIEFAAQYRPEPQGGGVEDVHTPLTIVCPDGQQYRAWVPLMHCDAPATEPSEQNSPEPHGGRDELDLTSTLFTARFSQLPPLLVHEENASGTTALPP